MQDLDIEIKIGIPIRSNRSEPFENGHYVTSDFEQAIYLGKKTDSDIIEATLNHETIHALLDLEFGKTVSSDYDNDLFFPDKENLTSYGEFGEWHIKGKGIEKGHSTDFHYWLDFFSPIKNADLEIHHSGHRKGHWWIKKLQSDVYSRDVIRTERLKRLGIKTMPLYQERLTRGWIRLTLLKMSQLPNTITLDNFMT